MDKDTECFYCNTPVPELRKVLEPRPVDSFQCDRCSYLMRWESAMCGGCGKLYPLWWWETRHEAMIDEAIDDLANKKIPDTLEIIEAELHASEARNLCCEMPPNECLCDKPIPAEELYQLPAFDFYDQTSECMHCAYIESAACPALRALAKKAYLEDWIDDREVPVDIPPITPCEKFQIIDIANLR